ncbi:hypothetical protein [Embleya sp. NPDC059237]|uniref:hypothetical protein n=1 Tax=Embleya sp. NPDC059237 TaxID=3346784 RepID=UPI00368D3E2F
MSRYRIAFDPIATRVRADMPADLRARFDRALSSLASDPYGRDTTPVSRSEPDRRQTVAAGCITVYYVGREIITITIVRIQPPP